MISTYEVKIITCRKMNFLTGHFVKEVFTSPQRKSLPTDNYKTILINRNAIWSAIDVL